MKPNHTIFIAGAGGIGRAVALLLSDYHDIHFDIFIGDISIDAAEDALSWVHKGVGNLQSLTAIEMPLEGLNSSMEEALSSCEILLDCLPGGQAPRMASYAKKYDLHYVNLTEYVNETNQIIDLAKNTEKGFVLQTGLAPGFINILANHLFKQFCRRHQVSKVDSVSMRVGALTKHTKSPHFYGFTWSPIGVATEYVKNSIVIRDGKKVSVPALSDRETMLIGGIRYEADLTSGGAADLPDVMLGKTDRLDYKTIRYEGHYAWVEKILEKLVDNPDAINQLEQTMKDEIPAVEEDIIVIYASVSGRDHAGKHTAIEKSFKIPPIKIGGQMLRGIQATTAAPMAQCALMLLQGDFSGVVYQSDIDPEEFMMGSIVRRVYYPESDPRQVMKQITVL